MHLTLYGIFESTGKNFWRFINVVLYDFICIIYFFISSNFYCCRCFPGGAQSYQWPHSGSNSKSEQIRREWIKENGCQYTFHRFLFYTIILWFNLKIGQWATNYGSTNNAIVILQKTLISNSNTRFRNISDIVFIMCSLIE